MKKIKSAASAAEKALEKNRQHQAEIAALLQAARAVLELHEFRDIARSIMKSCKKLIGAAAGYIALVSVDGEKNEVIYSDPPSGKDRGGIPVAMPMRGPFRDLCRTGRALYRNDFPSSGWARFTENIHPAITNVLLAPMILENTSSGVIGLSNKPGGFTKNDARMAAALAEIAAIGLRNSRTFDALRSSEARFHSIVDAARDAVINVDAAGDIVLWNDAAEKMFGYRAHEIIGKPFTTILPERHHEQQQQFFANVVTTKGINISEKALDIIGVKKNRSEFPLEGSFADWKIAGTFFVTVIFRDISERKIEEQKIHRQSAVLDAINQVLRETLTCETEEEVAHTCLRVAEQITGSSFGFIGEINKAGLFDTIALSDPGWEVCRVASTNAVVLIQNMEIRGIWGSVLKDGVSRMLNAPATHPDRTGTPEGHPPIKAFLGAPFVHEGKVTGMIALANKDGGYDEFDRQALESLSALFWQALTRKRSDLQIARLNEELRGLSFIDELTSLYNRRGFITVAERQLKIAQRMERESVLLFIDLDNMKQINDTLGHGEGDRALLLTSQVLKMTFRDSDIIARVGGDEFVVLAVEAPGRTANIMGSRLQEIVEAHNAKAVQPYRLSLSTGHAIYDPRSPCSLEELLTLADRSMYEQKRSKKSSAA